METKNFPTIWDSYCSRDLETQSRGFRDKSVKRYGVQTRLCLRAAACLVPRECFRFWRVTIVILDLRRDIYCLRLSVLTKSGIKHRKLNVKSWISPLPPYSSICLLWLCNFIRIHFICNCLAVNKLTWHNSQFSSFCRNTFSLWFAIIASPVHSFLFPI